MLLQYLNTFNFPENCPLLPLIMLWKKLIMYFIQVVLFFWFWLCL